ncbi:hypothetical protein AJ80_08272 [Polytolypa hystricis UAMH7299]|uniref:Glycosyl hydrolase n=1 Tax=Polytolypa hystricis (strain UAMH7299) TaxID=1447883 RepID=A0A2B7X2F6_POLH7|nr:hypothetical protein AJ80_08272 [Polytolypa hystricis UAMH7299]
MLGPRTFPGMGIFPPLRAVLLYLFLSLLFVLVLAHPAESVSQNEQIIRDDGQKILNGPPSTQPLSGSIASAPQKPIIRDSRPSDGTLQRLLNAIDVMQASYFEVWQGTWPSGNDWTRAVMGTQVSATLSALSWRLDDILLPSSRSDAAGGCHSPGSEPFDALAYENLINYYFQQTSAYYFGENAIGLRQQAYDDMLWVVLGWLENVKFQTLHSGLHYSSYAAVNDSLRPSWHGTQFQAPAAHRARVFYELASQGWDTALCDGGMIWSPYLTPYKNAITNELFISASIGMYLYFPGDHIDSPLMAQPSQDQFVSHPHDPNHLDAAIKAYKWLKKSNMTNPNNGLYADGFHIRGWNGPMQPGTQKCDVLNTMVYTYNQGVILSGLRGLWLATGSKSYLRDGHDLVRGVMKASGWSNTTSQKWRGLGRGGVLEEFCDSYGNCTQNGHTFKSIFFHHFAEFCRPLNPHEESFLSTTAPGHADAAQTKKRKSVFLRHLKMCSTYRSWIEHNANATWVTKNEEGKFGMWWGRAYPDHTTHPAEEATLPYGAIDYINGGAAGEGAEHLSGLLSNINGPHVGDGFRKHYQDSHERGSANNNVEETANPESVKRDINDRGRGRTVETQAGAVAVFRALYQWETSPSLATDPASSDL